MSGFDLACGLFPLCCALYFGLSEIASAIRYRNVIVRFEAPIKIEREGGE